MSVAVSFLSLSSSSCIIRNAFVILLFINFLTFNSALVQSPPLITKQPPTDEILFQVVQRQDENDKPFIIECEAEGEPQPKYRWVKNGKDFNWQAYDDRISQQPGRGTLVITSPRDEDIGQYQCYAYNEWGTATSNSVFLRKSELNSFKDEDPPTIVADEGKPFKISCNPPDGWPRPNVYWMLQNNLGTLKSINSSRITVDPEGTLWFSNVTRYDKSNEFLYACSAYSNFRNEYKLGNRVYLSVNPTSSTVNLNKHHPVVQYVSKRNTIGIRGTSINLWCIMGGTPLPEIKWSRKSQNLPVDRIEYDNYGKTLRINNIQEHDEGSYDCDATNGVGQPVSYSIHLSVYAIPYFTTEPEIINAAEGETIEFNCEANGKPSPEIKWIHNGIPIEKAEFNPRRKIKNNNKIIIENIVKSDTGNYGCNATNSFGYVYKDVYVNVLALPAEIKEKPDNGMTTDGKSMTLICRVFGAPKPQVKWIKNDQELTGGRFKILENGDLVIRDVTFVDAGEYVCYTWNKFGNDSAKGTLVVKERTRIVDHPEDYEVAAGTTATFRCSAVSDSTLDLTIEWLSDGKLIDFESEQRYVKLQDNSLTIDKTTELDSGIYTCLAKTKLDAITSNATLIVQDVPNQPQFLNIECGKRTANIRWRPMGDNRSPILYYTIQYNTSFTPDSWEVAFRDVPATETSYTVSMSPWSNYTFRVIARNKIGPSLPSEHSYPICLTPMDVPYKNPENVRGHGNQPNNLIIYWTAMPEIEHNAPKFKYQILWKPADQNAYTGQGSFNNNNNVLNPDTNPNSNVNTNWNVEEVSDWRQNQFTITNQPTYRPYWIKIKAINQVGESNVAPSTIVGYSGQDLPTEAPSNLTLLEKQDARTALISWNPVNPASLNGKFEGYKVQIWTEHDSENDMREILFTNDVTKALIDKFKPFAKNYLKVLAYNTDYDGPSSNILSFDTPEGTPGPVDLFEAFPLGASSIYLSWKEPEQPNGILKGYRIYYQKVVGTEVGTMMERIPMVDNPKQLRAKLSKLEPNTKYRIHIKAVTNQGDGEVTFIEESTYGNMDATNQVINYQLEKPRFRWEHEKYDDSDDDELNTISNDPNDPNYNANTNKKDKLKFNNNNGAIRIRWIPNFDSSGAVSSLNNKIRPGSHFYVQYKLLGKSTFQDSELELYEDNILIRGLQVDNTYVFRIVTVDGTLKRISDEEEIYIYPPDGPIILKKSPYDRVSTGWFIGLIVTLSFLVLILILICIIKRNRGGKYAVYEREIQHGRLDFNDDTLNSSNTYGGGGQVGGSNTGFREFSTSSSLLPSTQPPQIVPQQPQHSRYDYSGGPGGTNRNLLETDSNDFYDIEQDPKFNEDGSFIGQYGKSKNKNLSTNLSTSPQQSHSQQSQNESQQQQQQQKQHMATFV